MSLFRACSKSLIRNYSTQIEDFEQALKLEATDFGSWKFFVLDMKAHIALKLQVRMET